MLENAHFVCIFDRIGRMKMRVSTKRTIKQLFLLLIFSVCLLGTKPLYSSSRYVDSLVRVINTTRNETDRLHAMVNLSREVVPTNRDSAFALLTAASKLANDPNLDRQARYYTSWGLYYWYNREFDEAIDMYAKVFELPESDLLLSHLAEAANNMGSLLNRRGDVDSAGKLLHEALRIDMQREYMVGVAKTQQGLASFYLRQDKFELALGFIHAAIDYFISIGDSFRLTRAYNTLGMIYTKMNQLDKAIESYKLSEATAELPRDKDHLIAVLNNTFSSMISINAPFEESMALIDRVFEMLPDHEDAHIMLVLYSNKALLYKNAGELDTSLHYLRMALSFSRNPNVYVYHIASVYGLSGALHRELNNLDSARYYHNEALEMARKLGSLSLQFDNLNELSVIDSLQGDFRSAFRTYQKGIILKDSLWKIENQNRIAELQIIYETEKKEAENAALRESNQLKERVIQNQRLLMFYGAAAFLFFILFVFNLVRTKRKLKKINQELVVMNAEITAKQEEINRYNQELIIQKKELEELNRTKDKFFSIIAHDLKGPFSGLISLLDMMLNEFDTMTQDEKKAMLATIYRSSENTFNLIVNLLEWSRAQRGLFRCEPMQSNVKSIVQDALAVLATRIDAKQHTVAVHISDQLSCYCDPDLTKSIFINLVNNAIKFTPRNGLIEIYHETNNGALTLFVRDNGIGIQAEQLETLFKVGIDNQRKGTEGELGTGLGLVMVNEFVEMQKGSLTVKSTVGEGTTFGFTLPTAE